jgi:dGTPase
VSSYFRTGLAVFASDARASRGRRFHEPESRRRSAFQRDRDRVIHSTGFRRLKHKTQVFVAHEGDHYRTRLTHSLEVAQIARTLARALAVDEDLAETVALAHDLGHTPFGHTGEDALDEVMRPFGGFDHNAQTLRILTFLEHRYIAFDGLNLTWESLEGVVKHNGPLTGPLARDVGALPQAISRYVRDHDLELDSWPGLEAQLAALSDDIAYNTHDIDDGLRAGLFAAAELDPVPLVGPIAIAIRHNHPALELSRFIGELMRRMIELLVDDLLDETARRLRDVAPRSVAEVRQCGEAIASFSPVMAAGLQGLREFLHRRMYRHEVVHAARRHAYLVVQELFQVLRADPRRLPPEWAERAMRPGDDGVERVIADYIAGMTDNFATSEHRRLVTMR